MIHFTKTEIAAFLLLVFMAGIFAGYVLNLFQQSQWKEPHICQKCQQSQAEY